MGLRRHTGPGENPGEQVDDAGLAVGAGHADQAQVPRWPAMDGRRQQGHRLPDGGDDDGRRRQAQGTLTHQHGCPAAHRLGGEVVAIMGRPRNAAEQVAGLDASGIVAHAGHLDRSRFLLEERRVDPGGAEQRTEPHISR